MAKKEYSLRGGPFWILAFIPWLIGWATIIYLILKGLVA